MVVKSTDTLRVDFTEKTGYEIRLKDYVGVVFTVNMDGTFSIGQSTKWDYDIGIFSNIIIPELVEGKRFIENYIKSGSKPLPRNSYISKKNYVPGTIYKDYKGRTILYLGQGRIIQGFISNMNRSGCNYLWGTLNDKSIVMMRRRGDSLCIWVNIHYCYCDLDSHVGYPTKLVDVVASYPRITDICFYSSKTNELLSRHNFLPLN